VGPPPLLGGLGQKKNKSWESTLNRGSADKDFFAGGGSSCAALHSNKTHTQPPCRLVMFATVDALFPSFYFFFFWLRVSIVGAENGMSKLEASLRLTNFNPSQCASIFLFKKVFASASQTAGQKNKKTKKKN
jgi:hypothetical protein